MVVGYDRYHRPSPKYQQKYYRAYNDSDMKHKTSLVSPFRYFSQELHGQTTQTVKVCGINTRLCAICI